MEQKPMTLFVKHQILVMLWIKISITPTPYKALAHGWRNLMGALLETKDVDVQYCMDVGLPPPHVLRLIYGF